MCINIEVAPANPFASHLLGCSSCKKIILGERLKKRLPTPAWSHWIRNYEKFHQVSFGPRGRSTFTNRPPASLVIGDDIFSGGIS